MYIFIYIYVHTKMEAEQPQRTGGQVGTHVSGVSLALSEAAHVLGYCNKAGELRPLAEVAGRWRKRRQCWWSTDLRLVNSEDGRGEQGEGSRPALTTQDK